MIINKLSAHNIGPFKSPIEFEPDKLSNLVAITGANGAGKTFTLELVTLALYAYSPWYMSDREASIYSVCAPLATAYVEMEWTMPDGGRWKIRREIKRTAKTETHDAQIWKWDTGCGSWRLIADGVRPVAAAVEREMTSKSIFLSSAFNSQNSAGDLVDCTSDERKQLFASLIGLGHLQERAVLFAERVKQLDAIIQPLEAKRAAEVAHVIDTEAIAREVENLKAAKMEYEMNLDGARARRDTIITERAAYEEKKSSVAGMETELAGMKSKYNQVNGEKARLVELSCHLPAIENKLKELVSLRGTIPELEEQAARANEINSEVLKTNANIQSAINEKGQIQNKLNEIARKRSDIKILDGLNCEQNCQYVSNAKEALLWLHENVNNEQSENARVAELETQIQDMSSHRSNLLNNNDSLANINSRLASAKNQVAALMAENLEQRAADARTAAERIPALDAEITAIREKAQTVSEQIQAILQGNTPPDIAGIDLQIGEHERNIRDAADRISRLETQAQQSNAAGGRARIIESTMNKYAQLREYYGRLAVAFSRNGIQALIIDSEKQHFLEISRELFQILSGGKLSLIFETQRELKSKRGELRESFDLLVSNGMETRDVRGWSGGQQAMARIIMRATLGIYYAQKGTRIQTYFLDETTGSLDEQGRDSYLSFLKYLSRHFKQIFVISHQDVAKQIDCRIEVENGRISIA